jgi:hypothetical protein
MDVNRSIAQSGLPLDGYDTAKLPLIALGE